jgi:nucleoid DNA-binding protein
MAKETPKTEKVIVDKTVTQNSKSSENVERKRRERVQTSYEPGQNFNIADVVEATLERVKDLSLTKSQVNSVVRAVFNTVDDAIASDCTVKIAGFGKFYYLDKPIRIRRNIATGKRVVVNPVRVMKFHASYGYVLDLPEEKDMPDDVKEFLKQFPDGKEPGEVLYHLPPRGKKADEDENTAEDDDEDMDDSDEESEETKEEE